MQEENKYKAIYIDDNDQLGDEINFRELLEKYGYYWKWFLFGVLLSLGAAFLYLRYATYQYEVAATIVLNDEENGGGLDSELSALEGLGVFGGSKKSMETEIDILASNMLMERVIKEMDFHINYYKKGPIGVKEIYRDNVPFSINLSIKDSLRYKLDTVFSVKPTSDTRFALTDGDRYAIKEYAFGETIKCEFGKLMITPKDVNDVKIDEEIMIKISRLKRVAIAYTKRINIAPKSKESNLLVLKLKDPLKSKAQAILDKLISHYNQDAAEDKNQMVKNSDTFINNRIDDISVELANLDLNVETYKSENMLSDIDSEAGIVLQSNAILDDKIVELNSQIKLIDYMINYTQTNKDELIPDNMSVLNETASQTALEYNRLLLERNRLLKGANEKNPVVTKLNDQIAPLRESIEQSLQNSRTSLAISLNEARNQERKLNSRIYSAPKKEREIRDIQRQQQIVERLYLFLLQKREENSISLAANAPNAKVIDNAYGSNTPVSPKKEIVYIGAFLLGLMLPFSIIFVRQILDNKIHTHEEVEKIMNIPILGDIPAIKSKEKLIISEDDVSNEAESFRLLRTNVDFMLPGIGKEAKTVFVTSTISGEGKTFISINLASALALLNKKVLLIGADIRNPKMAKYLKMKNEKGLTHFLIDRSIEAHDVIVHHERTNLDILQSGIIPPNPSELLVNGRFEELIAFGRANYDFVIFDTAPVNVVTDTLLLSRYSDLFLYVVRANFLDKRLLKIPKMMYEKSRLPYMAIVINGTDSKKRGYSYGYGYGYGKQKTKRSWLKRIF